MNSGNNKRRRVRKPLWNDELTNKWNSVCQAEKQYFKCNTNDKSHLRHIFVVKRRDFDRLTQKVKRQFWHSSQDELIKLNDKDPRKFWKKIGKIGICYERQLKIPNEVLLDDGSATI